MDKTKHCRANAPLERSEASRGETNSPLQAKCSGVGGAAPFYRRWQMPERFKFSRATRWMNSKPKAQWEMTLREYAEPLH